MKCEGLIFYNREFPKEFRPNLEFHFREHVVCGAVESACPKTRGKCKITQYCYTILR